MEQTQDYDDDHNYNDEIEENAEYLKIEMMDEVLPVATTTVQYLCGNCGTGNLK